MLRYDMVYYVMQPLERQAAKKFQMCVDKPFVIPSADRAVRLYMCMHVCVYIYI